mgnify:FL=1
MDKNNLTQTDYSKYSVMVVDDIPVNILLVKGMLSKLHFNIMSATSGQEAIELLKRQKPSIILMDVMMPGMNGMETTKIIKANPSTKDIPVIFLSALTSELDIKEGLAAGGSDFITKPFIQETLVNTIVNHIKLSDTAKETVKDQASEAIANKTILTMLAYMATANHSQTARLLGNLAVCLPLSFIDESLFDIQEPTVQKYTEWAIQRLKESEGSTDSVSVNKVINTTIELLSPITRDKHITWSLVTTESLFARTDQSLFRSLMNNLLICACHISHNSDIEVSWKNEGGLLSVRISGQCPVEMDDNLQFCLTMAQEVAEKLNGTIMTDMSSGTDYNFQVLLQA